ncbi:MAG: hypothetical protein ACQEP1_04320 [Nanobdellota archaeon]
MTKRSQVTIFLVLVVLFALILFTVLALTGNGEESSVENFNVRDYMNRRYTDLEKCIILKSGNITELKPIDHYKKKFEDYIMEESPRVFDNFPDEIALDFEKKGIADADVMFTRETTDFRLQASHRFERKNDVKIINDYRQSHAVSFLTLHDHVKKIKEEEMIPLEYFEENPIDQKIYKDDDINYVLTDGQSEIDFRNYTMFYVKK